MIAEFGHILLVMAWVVAVMQATLPLWGAHKGHVRFMQFGVQAAILQFCLIFAAFAALTITFIQSDFSVKLAALHSHSAKPLIYKITGVWGNHEGSMLLWVLMLALFGALMAVFGRALPRTLKARAIGVQGCLGVGFLGFVLFTSNPFERLDDIPLDGQGLNPLLQDPGLILHPPFLYLGYVGFSLAYSLSVAALLEGRVDAIWARWLRPWVLLAWAFLTVGITLGSVWAYYELGWGGWWVWDPVENVSFMPWLLGTALVHSVLVLGTRHMMAGWTVLLGIATFSLSLIGTFVVRSGVLVSVHAFAVDPARGVFILGLIFIYTGMALALYALRSNLLKSDAHFVPVSREGGLVLNNILWVIATVTVFLGTFYPLFVDAISQEKITVGPPYFDLTFAPIMIVLILVMGIAPLLRWREDSLRRYGRYFVMLALILGAAIIIGQIIGSVFYAAIAMGLALMLAIGTVWTLWRRTQGKWTLIKAQPAALWGFALGHLGMAVITAGITVMSIGAVEDNVRMKIGDSVSVDKYAFTLTEVTTNRRDNYQYLAASFDVAVGDKQITQLSTERRYYPIRDMYTSEAGFNLGVFDTFFVAISEGDPDIGWIIRVYYHPWVVWIWFGAMMMALAGFVSLLDRRLRFERAVVAPKSEFMEA